MTLFVIGYDVRNKKRLIRVHRKMLRYAIPIEYSIFVLEGNEESLRRCVSDTMSTLDLRRDDFRCYRLPLSGFQVRVGRSVLPEGVFCTGLPSRIAFMEREERLQ